MVVECWLSRGAPCKAIAELTWKSKYLTRQLSLYRWKLHRSKMILVDHARSSVYRIPQTYQGYAVTFMSLRYVRLLNLLSARDRATRCDWRRKIHTDYWLTIRVSSQPGAKHQSCKAVMIWRDSVGRTRRWESRQFKFLLYAAVLHGIDTFSH